MTWLALVHGEGQGPPRAFNPGDDVRVWSKLVEQGKERLVQFEGVVIRCRGAGPSRTFTVRRITHGEGVERVFPLNARTLVKVEVLRRGRVKRSRLYFLRSVIGKARIASQESVAQPLSRSTVAQPSESEQVPTPTA